ncbi:MAG: GatB/YqeY domain-containing protein [Nitrospinae bacterium]|nr:GatB/YqeY domain-containing protein [Nitrospinota bacterium]
MDIKQRLLSDIKGAMKAQDSLRLSTLRLLSAEIKNKEIDLRRELNDEEVLTQLTSQIKKRKEAIGLFEKGGRDDLIEKERREQAILESYLPAQASEEELRSRIAEVVESTGAQGLKDLGKVMKVLVAEFKGKADSGFIKDLASGILGK